ncbi:hypothetical protein D3C72_1891320 [compost metagenome]
MLGDHVRMGDIRRRLRGAQHECGVLQREEALGDQHEAGHAGAHCQAECRQHARLAPQAPAQPRGIALHQP